MAEWMQSAGIVILALAGANVVLMIWHHAIRIRRLEEWMNAKPQKEVRNGRK